MQPAAVAGGDYAVSFGSYATEADAQRVVKALQTAQLPGYQETTRSGERTLHRVRIGPYATQAEAEAARLESAKVRSDVGAKVVTLDADTNAAARRAGQRPAASARVSAPVPLNPADAGRIAFQAGGAASRAGQAGDRNRHRETANPRRRRRLPLPSRRQRRSSRRRPSLRRPSRLQPTWVSPFSSARSAMPPTPPSCVIEHAPPVSVHSWSRYVPTRAC